MKLGILLDLAGNCWVKKDCEVSAVCFINADYADFSYSIPVDIMKTFIDMDIPLQFDVLSWGLVEGGETK